MKKVSSLHNCLVITRSWWSSWLRWAIGNFEIVCIVANVGLTIDLSWSKCDIFAYSHNKPSSVVTEWPMMITETTMPKSQFLNLCSKVCGSNSGYLLISFSQAVSVEHSLRLELRTLREEMEDTSFSRSINSACLDTLQAEVRTQATRNEVSFLIIVNPKAVHFNGTKLL